MNDKDREFAYRRLVLVGIGCILQMLIVVVRAIEYKGSADSGFSSEAEAVWSNYKKSVKEESENDFV